jgi:serine protease inhibitor
MLPNRSRTAIVHAVNRLGREMLSKVCDDGLTTDAAISPLSILIALTMLAGGANNLDHEELCRKLGIENVATLSKMVLQIQNSLYIVYVEVQRTSLTLLTKASRR